MKTLLVSAFVLLNLLVGAQSKTKNLPEVEVNASKILYSNVGATSRNSVIHQNSILDSSHRSDGLWVQLIRNPGNAPKKIHSFRYYLPLQRHPEALFEITFRKFDVNLQLPGEVIAGPIKITGGKGGRWNEVNISEMYLTLLSEGVVIEVRVPKENYNKYRVVFPFWNEGDPKKRYGHETSPKFKGTNEAGPTFHHGWPKGDWKKINVDNSGLAIGLKIIE